GASIVPDRPRLLAVLYKGNFTHDLVAAKGSFTLSVLADTQTDLLPILGFTSGRNTDKLAGLAVDMTKKGNPVFRESLGWLEVEVIDAFDLGDATAYLGSVVDSRKLRDEAPMNWAAVRQTLPRAWLE